VLGGGDGAAHRGNIAGDTRGGLVVHHHHTLDGVALVGADRLLDAVGMDACAPLFFLPYDLEPMAAGEIDPQMAELTEPGSKHLVAGRTRIGERGFPGAGAARRIDEDLAVFS